MNWKTLYQGLALGCGLAAGGALGQQAAPATAPAPAAVPAAGASTPSAPRPAKRNAQMEAGEPRADTSALTKPAPPAPSAPAGAPKRSTASMHARNAAVQQAPAANDRVELDTTTVTGNQELPKVLYIVPWKKSDIGDLAGKPMNSLLDEVLAPVDRDVFRREVRYYDAVKSDAGKGGAAAPGAPSKQVEK